MLSILNAYALAEAHRRYPNIPEQHLSVRKYTDKTANGLTRCIIDFLRLQGWQAERINSTGRVIDNRKQVTDVMGHTRMIGSQTYIPTTGTKGTADISATIAGRSIKIEVKIGKDRQSEAQKDYEQAVTGAGGVYIIAKNFEQFAEWYMQFLNTTLCNTQNRWYQRSVLILVLLITRWIIRLNISYLYYAKSNFETLNNSGILFNDTATGRGVPSSVSELDLAAPVSVAILNEQMETFVKIYRKFTEKAFYSHDSEKVHLWIHLLLKATWSGRSEMLGGKPIQLMPGQLTTGRMQLSRETGISESKIERILTYFEKIEQQIEQRKTSTNRLITIINWKEYQSTEQQIEQQLNNDRTTSEQRVNNDRTHYKKDNKEKKEKKEINIGIGEFSPVFGKTLSDFYQMRLHIKKPMTNRAKELLLMDLEKLAPGNEGLKIKILEQSILNSWQGVFPLKTDNLLNPYNIPQQQKMKADW